MVLEWVGTATTHRLALLTVTSVVRGSWSTKNNATQTVAGSPAWAAHVRFLGTSSRHRDCRDGGSMEVLLPISVGVGPK